MNKLFLENKSFRRSREQLVRNMEIKIFLSDNSFIDIKEVDINSESYYLLLRQRVLFARICKDGFPIKCFKITCFHGTFIIQIRSISVPKCNMFVT